MKLKAPAAIAATARSPINWFPGICLAAFLTTIPASAAAPQTGAGGLNPAEEWVVAQATAGEIADLSKRFPDEDKRKLSAHFLEKLLTGALARAKPHRNGVRIFAAIIDEPIDIGNAQIPCEVWLHLCQFNKSVTFNSASFAGNVSFQNSAFKAEANFNSMKVGGVADFNNAVFDGSVNFIWADIAIEFEAQEAKFQNKEEGANFNGMKVGGTAYFNKAVFEGPVGFVGANIAWLVANEARFNNKQQGANFNSMKIGHDASFNNAVFDGSVNFVGADIASNFDAGGTKFQNKESIASFNSMKVGGFANFNNAVFDGSVNFTLADIAIEFDAHEAQFQNKEEGANFNGMKVRGVANFNKAVFEGPVVFVGANIASNFEANEAQFQNKEQGATFNSLKVGHSAFFIKTVLEGPVDFVAADIASNFEANEAQFQNKEASATFYGMKVGGQAFFNDAVFEGSVDLRYADFGLLDLSGASWPGVAAQFYMQGTSYKYIRAAPEEPESHKALMKLADQSAYTSDVYSKLEEFFLRQGYRSDADKVFIAGKRRERKEKLHGLDWLGSYLLDWLVGYGRRPWQAGIPCAVLVALGCVLFSPEKMEPQKPEDTPRVYSRFWYSLGLFLPFVDLQADKVWKPKADQTFLRNYMRVHIMLGWILVPLVLAALTGLIK